MGPVPSIIQLIYLTSNILGYEKRQDGRRRYFWLRVHAIEKYLNRQESVPFT